MNYLQLVQRLKRESGRSGNAITTLVGLSANDQRLADWVADAWIEVQRRFQDWKFMRHTVSGPLIVDQIAYRADEINAEAELVARWQPQTKDYTVRVAAPDDDQPFDLNELDYETFQARYIVRTETAGRPRHWCRGLDQRILIGPAPDVEDYILTADYWSRPTALSADDDVPGMPEEYHMLLVWRALVELAAFDAAIEVDARARRNLKTAWSDLMAYQTPDIRVNDEPLC